jgi:UDP-N-acetylglucosamine 3-dehydrogenase
VERPARSDRPGKKPPHAAAPAAAGSPRSPDRFTALPRVLLVGVGRWGANHLRVWQALGMELFVADCSAAQRSACRDAGVPADHLATDAADVLDRVDVVDVVTPVDSHYRVALAALEAGKDVFVEKPLAATSDEAAALDRRAAELGRVLQVGHIFRYDPAVEFVRGAIARDELGPIRYLHGRFTGFKRPRADCGVTAADALHFIDLFGFLLGCSPRAVSAHLSDLLGRGMDDASWVRLEYDRAFGIVEANYFSPDKDRRVIVVGERGTAVCDLAACHERVRIYANQHVRDGQAWKAVEGQRTVPRLAQAEPLARELDAFVASWRTREQPLADAAAGCSVIRIIEAAQRSSETGQAVALQERECDAECPSVPRVRVRRDQAEGARGHRLGPVHPRPPVRRV